ncbi:hypothetical protein MHLP_00525 [Candidatus Mycoplasma haematolamae str. Purdue]|uniref:Uncharacterized protein n=1 Tax=Mycoplasma haematolamae (strain Purdue) TaxID=1212765 RepID=I7B8W5_MYCHA|nr:hypothetical protein MHLP_00525 [Candidatus Mycoplasma haematolamae str. Purdue]
MSSASSPFSLAVWKSSSLVTTKVEPSSLTILKLVPSISSLTSGCFSFFAFRVPIYLQLFYVDAHLCLTAA